MSYQSFEQILQKCHTEGKEFWQVIMEDDMAERNVSEQDSMEHMRTTWDAMLLAAATYEGDIKSSSGLVGGDGQRMEEYTHNTGKESLCGEYVDECIAGALQMGESNACMKRIVAAPTAGACGVLPAVLVPYFKTVQGYRQNSESHVCSGGDWTDYSHPFFHQRGCGRMPGGDRVRQFHGSRSSDISAGRQL